jgi:succinoglycan biosynthesis transport protein ExoP
MTRASLPLQHSNVVGGGLSHGEDVPAETSGPIDLRAVWSAVYRNRIKLLITIVVAMLLGLLVTFLSTPIFRGEARIQIDQQAAQILAGTDVEPSESMLDGDRFLQTQIDVIKSRTLARQVAESAGLYRGNAFLEKMHIKPADEPRGAYNLAQTHREQVVDALQKNLDVELPVDSRIVTISFSSPDRLLSAQVANGFADSYIVGNIQRKFNTSAYARRFLEDQLRQTRQRLEESERAQIAYARSAGLVDPSSGGADGATSGPRSLTTANLVQLNQAYSQAVGTRIAAEQRWIEASSTPALSQPEVLNNPAIQILVQERTKAQADYAQNAKRYLAGYPGQTEAAAQIATLTTQINRLASGIRDGVRQQYTIAANQEKALLRDLEKLKGTTLTEQGRGVQANILRREVDTNRALYDALLQRYKGVSATAGVSSNNVSIIDRADPPVVPVSPRLLLNLALALFAGMLLGVGYVTLREHFDDAIRSSEDIETELGASMIGLVPMLPAGQEPNIELQKVRSETSEAYYALRAALELATPTGAPHSLMVTSTGPSEGKSTTSYALARGFAQIGRRVVLIDADMRKPAQHKNLDLPNKTGLANLLARQATLADVLQHTPTPNLDFISAGPSPVNPAELIAGAGLAKLIDQIKGDYDIILVDAPPVLGLADAPTLASHVEATLFVVQANHARGRQARVALTRLKAARAHVVGVLLTKFDAKSTGHSADYGYSYSYGQTDTTN